MLFELFKQSVQFRNQGILGKLQLHVFGQKRYELIDACLLWKPAERSLEFGQVIGRVVGRLVTMRTVGWVGQQPVAVKMEPTTSIGPLFGSAFAN